MKELARLVGILTLCCLIAGLLLSWVNSVTSAPIAEAARAEQLAALKAVLPEYDNQPDIDIVSIPDESGTPWIFHIARKSGAYAGCAFKAVSSQGYAGDIAIMVGITADGTVQGVEVLAQKETPGLGARITEPAFRSQFAGKPIEGTIWKVRKEQGNFDQVTAATISSRAVLEAMDRGFNIYRLKESTIRESKP
ncbi:MAG: hypothetical protein A2498_12630 [Lentisphaerae bacterium RIFOXYC12_FULL_60_16]|nr:MAG: hypothetical protein A2498_12630 [Lentisphaerae bacterium RIFOXYC12_FULL_60_16]